MVPLLSNSAYLYSRIWPAGKSASAVHWSPSLQCRSSPSLSCQSPALRHARQCRQHTICQTARELWTGCASPIRDSDADKSRSDLWGYGRTEVGMGPHDADHLAVFHVEGEPEPDSGHGLGSSASTQQALAGACRPRAGQRWLWPRPASLPPLWLGHCRRRSRRLVLLVWLAASGSLCWRSPHRPALGLCGSCRLLGLLPPRLACTLHFEAGKQSLCLLISVLPACTAGPELEQEDTGSPLLP